MKISFAHLRLLLVLAYLLAACTLQQPATTQADLSTAYHSAVKDAEIAETHEIYKNLVAIVPANANLVWKKQEQKTFVLVVTWTNYDGYDDKTGQTVELPKEIWVTTVPELRKFCQKLATNRTLRLEQLLGLPPNSGKTKFVEMWAKPDDLFRPSADPEISDSEAEIDFRTSNKFVKASDDYKKWFHELKMNSYGANGYPWTRLGYTYDWGTDNRNHVGLSEFVIMKGSAVIVESVSTEMQYCR